jgi:hypothetical protein
MFRERMKRMVKGYLAIVGIVSYAASIVLLSNYIVQYHGPGYGIAVFFTMLALSIWTLIVFLT